MISITRAAAVCNNEVAYLAWVTDPPTIPGCLGFHIVREHLADQDDSVTEERPLASYVAFKGQRNPDWLAQNTSVWPVQKFTWRDLTLRKLRDKAERRVMPPRVRYRIRAVGPMEPGLEPMVVVPSSHTDFKTQKLVQHTYKGRPRPLAYLSPPTSTNIISATSSLPPFTSTFTNGILSTQFLLRVLSEDGKIESGELERRLRAPGDRLRTYLSGEVLPLIRAFFDQPGGRFHAALYELEDEELVGLLSDNADRIDLILSDAGSGADNDGEPNDKGKSTLYDTRNAPARALLHKLARKRNATFTIQDRLFNGSNHIRHNKFVVYVDDGGVARSVLTGSTNWTWSGIAGQSNNCIRIDHDEVAKAYVAYWTRLHDDKQPVPDPTSAKNPDANQSDELKEADRMPESITPPGAPAIEMWFSPNVPRKDKPPSPKAKNPPPPPPDMDRLFSLVRKARRAIFFLVFMPSRGGINSIVSESVALGLKDTSLDVIGGISDSQAMWGFEAASKGPSGKKVPSWSPHVFSQDGVSVVRATALTDKEIRRPLGDFQNDEKLTVGRAIIHDKVVVTDPMDPEHCMVAFGSHNLGYRASYANDENLMIVRGHQPLALAYATHVLDVYDHYRFRAVEAELSGRKRGNAAAEAQFDGFLDVTDRWQETTGRRLAAYFTE